MVKVKLVNHDIGFCRAYYKVVEHECFEGRIWCVINITQDAPNHTCSDPSDLDWFTCQNEIDGEPCSPIRETFKNEIEIIKE